MLNSLLLKKIKLRSLNYTRAGDTCFYDINWQKKLMKLVTSINPVLTGTGKLFLNSALRNK